MSPGSLAVVVESVFDSVIAPGARVALVGYPKHANPGDAAAWKGTVATLRRSHPIVYVCDQGGYSPSQLRQRLGGGTILLEGGGNFGDLYPWFQRFRERVIQDFPDVPIVQLPQSMHFQQESNLERAQQIFGAHPDLTLLLRDQASLDAAQRAFPNPVRLCPDPAVVLRPRTGHHRMDGSVLWIARADAESRYAPIALPADIRRMDWPVGDRRGRIHGRADRVASDCGKRIAQMAGPEMTRTPLLRGLAGLYHAIAADRVRQAQRLLISANVVITDRLHAHILALLLGQPHVLLDNSYGKVRSFFETWTSDSPVVRWADSPGEALSLARELVT